MEKSEAEAMKEDIRALQLSDDKFNEVIFQMAQDIKEMKSTLTPISKTYEKSQTIYAFILTAFKASAWVAGFMLSIYAIREAFFRNKP